MKKRIFAAILASTCAISSAVPAFAADTTQITGVGAVPVEVQANVEKPQLDVTIPSTTEVMVNPYRLPIDVSAAQDGSELSYDTVITTPMHIENASDCAITVGVKGMFQTKVKSAGFDKTDSSTYAVHIDNTGATTPAPAKGSTTVITNSTAANDFYVLTDNKTIVDGDGYILTGTYVAEKVSGTGATEKVTAGTLKITAYTASKAIKVGTVAIKDVDTEKTNTIFMYAEGSTDGTWAEAFDATKAKTPADAKNPTSMMILGTKETSQKILFVGGKSGAVNGEGYVRITGQSATNPTTPWADVTDEIDTPFAFVIDAVANKAPVAPKITGVDVTGDNNQGVTVTQTSGKTTEWDVAVTGAGRNDVLTFDLTGLDPADATLTWAPAGELVAEGSADNKFKVNANPSGTSSDLTVTATSMGKTSTFVFHVTISA